jgi:hypothetical protein
MIMSQGNDENGDLIKSPKVDDQITEDVKITTLWGDFPKESK